jgi:hypothetical protein
VAASSKERAMPTKAPCWADDKDYLDGRTKIDFPSEKLLRAYWDTDILDPEDEPSHRIIDAGEAFKVRIRLELVGDLWTCVCGDWCFDLRFTPIGKGTGFDLSDLLGDDSFSVKDWKGCQTRCIELLITVPPDTIPVEKCSGTLYECGAVFQLFCCGERAGVVGSEPLEEYQFYKAGVTD